MSTPLICYIHLNISNYELELKETWQSYKDASGLENFLIVVHFV